MSSVAGLISSGFTNTPSRARTAARWSAISCFMRLRVGRSLNGSSCAGMWNASFNSAARSYGHSSRSARSLKHSGHALRSAAVCDETSSCVFSGLRLPAVHGVLTQQLFDPEQLIVLGHAVGSAERAGFDLAGVGGHGNVGNGGV